MAGEAAYDGAIGDHGGRASAWKTEQGHHLEATRMGARWKGVERVREGTWPKRHKAQALAYPTTYLAHFSAEPSPTGA